VAVLVDEHYEGGGKPVSYHATVIKAKRAQFEGRKIALTYLDPACWAKTQSNGSRIYAIVDEYNDHGIYPVPGQNNWEAGFNLCTEALRPDPNKLHPVTNAPGAYGMYVFSNCHHYIREKVNYRWKKARGVVLRNAPDEPIDYQDHAMDAERYFFASLRPQPTAVAPPTAPVDPRTIVHEAIKRWNPLEGVVPSGASWMSH
jgi:hypothetical protein